MRNSTTYNFEEWCRMRNQNYANELAQMNQQIQEQEHRKQEVINRIQQERRERNAAFKSELEKQRQTQQQIVNKEKIIDEEKLNRDKLASEGKITSGSQEKISRLNRELTEIKQTLEEHIRKSQERKEVSRQQMETYIEQLLTSNYRS